MRLRSLMALTLLAAACGGGSDGSEDPGWEPLPVDSATAAAAAELVLDGVSMVEANCAGGINCPDNVPGAPMAMSVDRRRLTVTNGGAVSLWEISADLEIHTITDIPVVIPLVGNCGIKVDTHAGADSIITVAFSETFYDDVPLPAGDRIAFGGVTLTGLTTDDVALTGGTACVLANVGLGFFIGILAGQVADHPGSLCGSGGPELFRECPEPAGAVARPGRETGRDPLAP